MAPYRLIDELPDAQKRKPPFAPLGLFLVNFLFLPLAAPFWVINWARLGRPEKRLVTGVLAVVAFVLHIYLLLRLNPDAAQTYAFLPPLVFAYWQLYAQRPLYQAHVGRGGPKAPAWPVWVAAGIGIALHLFLMFIPPSVS